MALVKATFFLPLRDNDGRDLTAESVIVMMKLFNHFDGWTYLGEVRGAFRMPDGTESLDESKAYLVILDEGKIPELEQILREFKAQTTQVAIYLEIQHDLDIRFV